MQSFDRPLRSWCTTCSLVRCQGFCLRRRTCREQFAWNQRETVPSCANCLCRQPYAGHKCRLLSSTRHVRVARSGSNALPLSLCDDKHIWAVFVKSSSERLLLVRPKSIGLFHSEFAEMLEFIDGFQLILISFNVVRLPQGFRSMDLGIDGWLIRRRPVLHIVVLDICAIVVRVFLGVGAGLSGSSGGLRPEGVRLSHT